MTVIWVWTGVGGEEIRQRWDTRCWTVPNLCVWKFMIFFPLHPTVLKPYFNLKANCLKIKIEIGNTEYTIIVHSYYKKFITYCNNLVHAVIIYYRLQNLIVRCTTKVYYVLQNLVHTTYIYYTVSFAKHFVKSFEIILQPQEKLQHKANNMNQLFESVTNMSSTYEVVKLRYFRCRITICIGLIK